MNLNKIEQFVEVLRNTKEVKIEGELGIPGCRMCSLGVYAHYIMGMSAQDIQHVEEEIIYDRIADDMEVPLEYIKRIYHLNDSTDYIESIPVPKTFGYVANCIEDELVKGNFDLDSLNEYGEIYTVEND